MDSQNSTVAAAVEGDELNSEHGFVSLVHLQYLIDKVFRIDEILETIIRYVMAADDNEDDGEDDDDDDEEEEEENDEENAWKNVDYSSIMSCRLVCKKWNKTVSRVFYQLGAPLFHLTLNGDNSLNNSLLVQENGKLLDNFLQTVKKMQKMHYDNKVPPYALTIESVVFRHENYKIMRKFLLQCCGGLVRLKVSAPLHGGSLMFVLPSMSFLKLHDITIQLSPTLNPLENGERICSSENLTHMINFFLNGSPNLANVYFPSAHFDTGGSIHFELMSLPSNLTAVTLYHDLNDRDLQVLITNQLPRLKKLQILVKLRSFEEGLLYQVLDNFKKTLQEFWLIREQYRGPPRNVSILKFPIMPCLKVVTINSINVSLANSHFPHSLTTCLPHLETLSLYNLAATEFAKWTHEHGGFESVNCLKLLLADENFSELNYSDYVQGISLPTMEIVNKSFPSLRQLVLTLQGLETSGLRYVFQEMLSIEQLLLDIAGVDEDIGTDLWDTLFIGGPVNELREKPELLDNRDHTPLSIRNLTRLRVLELADRFAGDRVAPLMSDAAFEFGFLRMPNLVELSLGGRFRASERMVDTWFGQGRILLRP